MFQGNRKRQTRFWCGGNACLYILAQANNSDAKAELTRLKSCIHQAGTLKTIDKYLANSGV